MRKLLGELLSKLLRKLLRKLWAFSKGLKISKDNKHRSKSAGQSLKVKVGRSKSKKSINW